jgi:hypothetical protein
MNLKNEVEMYLISKGRFFPPEGIPELKERLENLTELQFMTLNSFALKDPSILLILSIVGGWWGIDSFVLGNTQLGVLRLSLGIVFFIIMRISLTNFFVSSFTGNNTFMPTVGLLITGLYSVFLIINIINVRKITEATNYKNIISLISNS